MLVLVLINTGIIFISGFMPGQEVTLLLLDGMFTMLFLIEALVKIHVLGSGCFNSFQTLNVC